MATQLLLLDLGDDTRARATAPRMPAPFLPPGLFPSGTRSAHESGTGMDAGHDPVYWRLDDHTREVGRRGVEDARRALAAAIRRIEAAASIETAA